jgi:ATP-dependent Clp protease ATP-binding subunit ClpC
MATENLSPEAKQILALARQESENLQHFYLGVEHIFIALTKVENGVTHSVLQQSNLDPKQVRDAIHRFVGSGDSHRYWEGTRVTPRCEAVLKLAAEEAGRREKALLEEKDLLLGILKEGESLPVRVLQKMGVSIAGIIGLAEEEKVPGAAKQIPYASDTPILDKFGRDITRLAKEGKIDPVIGRGNEILQLVRTLTRKTKNNPLLIGEAGVGKTAIVEGLALRIAQGKLAESLRDRRIIELSLASVVAGTKYRGEFEERVMGIVSESRDHHEAILFLDEIHTLIGAGAAEGGMDASNILKPALARGDIRCIGATTITEYRKHIEKDAALERRFQPIMVHEPSVEDTLEILKQLRERYEKHHQVRIAEEAVEAAVRLSAKYVPDRRLPDKALDALDEACTSVKVPILSMYGEKEAQIAAAGEVTAENVAEVISKWTGIPVRQLTMEERERLLHMADIVKKRVIGQDEAVNRVAEVVKMARAGLKDPRHPTGVFLFLGPTGVGKTELVKATAEFLFGSENEMICLDMSEFMEKHSISKLIGAPPGYVGYEEEGQLTGRLRRKPYSVVLLDEIEKAHPEIFDLFLQVFDEGRLTDSKGRTVDARNAIFIMTSNIGTELYKREPIGFRGFAGKEGQQVKEEITTQLRKTFRPEFLNRLDEVIFFEPLKAEDLSRIGYNLLQDLRKRLEEKGILFDVEEEALELICRQGYDPMNGARPLARTIERLVTKPLSEKIIAAEFVPGDKILVRVSDSKIVFSKVEEDEETWA